MIVPAALAVYRIVFGCVKHHALGKFAIMQHLPAVDPLFIVPVHHDRFAVVGVALKHAFGIGSARLAVKERRIGLLKLLGIHTGKQKQMLAVLQIAYTGLPVKAAYVHAAHVHVTKAVFKVIIPENAVRTYAVLELVPEIVRISRVKRAAIQDHGNDGRKRCRLLAVTGLSRKAGAGGKMIHHVRMAIGNAVEQPCRTAQIAHLARRIAAVSALPIQLVLRNARVKWLLCRPPIAQDACRLGNLLLTDRQRLLLLFLKNIFDLHNSPYLASGSNALDTAFLSC